MPNFLKNRASLLGGTALLALFSAGVITTLPSVVYADAVKLETPQAVPNFADVVEAVSPAVVSVRVQSVAQPASFDGTMEGLPKNHPFRKFFDKNPFGEMDKGRKNGRNDHRGRARQGASQGSGFFVSADGYIVTNNHVVANGSKFTIVLNDGEEMPAELIGTDPKTDLAVLKVDTTGQTYVSFTEARSRVGEWVVAVGNPFGLGGTVTAGIVSGMNRDIGSGPYDDFLQIDAAVNKGNSGGPAFNLSGEVVGVNTAIFSPSGGNVGIAFAISAKSANEVVNDLIANGRVTRGWLGVQIQPVTDDIAASLDLSSNDGAIIAEAQDDSPAAIAGLTSGDVILSVNGEMVDGPKELARLIAGVEPGEVVAVEIFRNGSKETVDVELGALPGTPEEVASTDAESTKEAVEFAELGFSVRETSEGLVVTEVEAASAAANKGLSRGDMIAGVNGTPTVNVDAIGKAFAEAVSDNRKAILLRVKTGERSRFVALPVDTASTKG